MRFILRAPEARHEIHKARGRPRSAEYPRLNNLADTVARTVKANLLSDLRAYQRAVDIQSVALALQNRDVEALLRTVDARNIGDQFLSFETAVRDGFIEGGRLAARLMPQVIVPEIVFNASHPRVETFIRNRVAEQVVGITARTQEAIQGAVIRMMDEGIPANRGAALIRGMIGLTPQQTIAVENFRHGLEENNVPEGRADQMTERYADRQLSQRAETIARTESQTAVNGGQQELWQQAVDDGLMNPDETQKEWIIDPGTVCPICFEIQANGPVGVEEDFEGPDGPISAPPAHPRCNCGMALVFGSRSITS